MRGKRAACRALLALVLAFGGAAGAGAQVLFDATVATVNGDLVMRSDVLWNLALDPSVRAEDFWSARAQENMLRTLIDQRLLVQEAAKLPATDVSDAEVQVKLGEIAAQFNTADDPSRFTNRMKLVGLTSARLDEIIRTRIRIEKYIDFRFRSFVVVTETEVSRYYDTEVRPRLLERGVVAPPQPTAEQRQMIERAIAEEKINAAIDAYLEEARSRAEIVLLK